MPPYQLPPETSFVLPKEIKPVSRVLLSPGYHANIRARFENAMYHVDTNALLSLTRKSDPICTITLQKSV